MFVFFFMAVVIVVSVMVVATLAELAVFDCDKDRVGGLVLIGRSLIIESDNADEDEWRSGLRR
jgi:hypothetical protein